MSDPTKTPPEAAPGHYGAGYGEQVPADADPAPKRERAADVTAPAGLEPIDRGLAPDAPAPVAGDSGEPVVFTPEDVHSRPPDRPPTEQAPESEKTGLIFERS